MVPNLIVLVTGESCAGKDYCADIWATELTANTKSRRTAHVVGISDAIKEKYTRATGADLNLLLQNREYKEEHRAALTAFWENQIKQQPQLPEDNFVDVVRGSPDVDLLLITGMRDKAPVASFSHISPESRMLEVRVQASKETRTIRRGRVLLNDGHEDAWTDLDSDRDTLPHITTTLEYCPSLIFNNDKAEDVAIKEFAVQQILPFFHGDLERLANMVPSVSDFPLECINFRHILNIPQQQGGLGLCTSLLETHFSGDWTKINTVVACEAGGYVFAAPLAMKVARPLALVRKGGKLPPPTSSVTSSMSHISSLTSSDNGEGVLEIEEAAIAEDSSVMVIDDVLASGKTLYAVLQLLRQSGIRNENINVMVVAEFPGHRAREFLYRHGFGKVKVQSLLVFGGS